MYLNCNLRWDKLLRDILSFQILHLWWGGHVKMQTAFSVKLILPQYKDKTLLSTPLNCRLSSQPGQTTSILGPECPVLFLPVLSNGLFFPGLVIVYLHVCTEEYCQILKENSLQIWVSIQLNVCLYSALWTPPISLFFLNSQFCFLNPGSL